MFRGDGRSATFKYDNTVSSYRNASNPADTLIRGASGFTYTNTILGVVETYDLNGVLLSESDSAGNVLTYTYSTAGTAAATAPAAGYLISVTDNTGRSINFAYTLPAGGVAVTDGLITSITNSGGQATTLGYDANRNLVAITWPDAKVLQLVYENTAFPWALTGLIDENGVRTATYGYDTAGRAISSTLAGGVDSYSVTYGTPPQITSSTVTDPVTGVVTRTHAWTAPTAAVLTLPNGQTASIGGTSVVGYNRLTSSTQPAGSGCAAASSAAVFDANGNLASSDDFNAQRSCFGYDANNQRNLSVEGLANTVSCASVLPLGATLPDGVRRITKVFHPDWKLPVQITAPGAISTTVYQGQSDPFNANAPASCTTAAVLPNGKVLPLVCKTVTQATLASGAPDGTVPNVVETFTYDPSGRILTSTDSLNRTTSYAYYGDTAFSASAPNELGHTVGDLQSITNAAGMVVYFNTYDRLGRILQSTDPKGITTQTSYTARGWVSTVSTTAPGAGARTTTYSYDGAGQLIGVSAPDGTTLSFTYDAAHRLTGASDPRGNTVAYTLDNLGNRIGEQVKDPTGVLQRAISRSFDALNRLQQVSGATQ